MSQKPARKHTPFAKYRKNSKKMQKSVDRRLGMWYYT